ncbi:Gfo/Idh/MocA family oxidoreductase [candidate division KSB1 bacterium]|nr:Gfo/Idh/MocA family oxidoreductase [candidate division KSB1 bacterium]
MVKRQNRRTFIKSTGTAAFAVSSMLYSRIQGANDRLHLGIVGCGTRGNYLMREACKLADKHNIEITALCDVWKKNLSTTMANLAKYQRAKPATYSRYQDMLTQDHVDAVIIATPDFAHTPILIEALKANKDAFVEKPMATRIDHAREAVDLVKEKNAVVQVGTQRRSDFRHMEAARLIHTGMLGTVSEIETAWHDASPRWARDFSDVKQDDVDWEQYLMDLPKEPFSLERFRRWHFYRDFTVGTPGLLGIHRSRLRPLGCFDHVLPVLDFRQTADL